MTQIAIFVILLTSIPSTFSFFKSGLLLVQINSNGLVFIRKLDERIIDLGLKFKFD